MQRLHVRREHNNWFCGHCIGCQLVTRSNLRCYFWTLKPFTIWHLDISRTAFSSQFQPDRLDLSEREFCDIHSFRYPGIWGEETLLLHPQYYGMAFLWKLGRVFPSFCYFESSQRPSCLSPDVTWFCHLFFFWYCCRASVILFFNFCFILYIFLQSFWLQWHKPMYV